MELLLTIWPDRATIAKDLGLPYPTVNSWGSRRIPPKHYGALIAAAKARGHDLRFEELEAANESAAA